MPLIKSNLEQSLRSLLDKDYVNFEGFPNTSTEVAERWSKVVNDYASTVVPFSTTSVVAKAAFKSTMLAITPSPPNGLALLTTAFSTYASTLAGGMQPGFTATPPTSPINLAPVISLGMSGASGAVIAASLANVIHSWFKTGLATNNSSGTTILWS